MHKLWRQKRGVQQLSILFALALIALIPAVPYFISLGDGVPRTNDLFPHLHRAYALSRTAELTGQLWPRWSPHLVHGYGYPVFNYFPSLSHWLIVLIHWLGVPLTTAYRISVYIHLLTAATGAYSLGRTLWRSQAAGWLTALTYTYSPYLLYDIIVRGSPPETQALALLPWLVLALHNLTEKEATQRKKKANSTTASSLSSILYPLSPSSFLLTALLYAAMILSHHPVTLQISFLLGIWLLWRVWWQEKAVVPALWRLAPPLLALLLGGLLTAFFSLPGLLEIDLTRAQLSISQGYTYETNFLPFGDLFQQPITPPTQPASTHQSSALSRSLR